MKKWGKFPGVMIFWGVLMMTGISGGGERIILPSPGLRGEVSVEEAILKRRSVRSFLDDALSLGELSQILFSAQGITEKNQGFLAAPSAGALYPLVIYAVVGKVEELTPGVYRYYPQGHAIEKVLEGDRRGELYRAALSQGAIRGAPVSLVFAAIYERTTVKYGERGIRYVHIEIGHAAQNVYLQAEALGLGTVAIGAFYDEEIARVLSLPLEEAPLYIMPVGKVRK